VNGSSAARVTVVIPSWNGRKLLEPCLRALQAQTLGPLEVTVVDNGSADGTVDWLRAEHPRVRVVIFPDNRGFAAAVNAGIAAAETEYVALLNNDTEPAPAWLASLVSALDRRLDCTFAASKMVRLDAPDTIDSAGDQFTLHGLGYKRGEGFPARTEYLVEEEVTSACAGAALYRRTAFADVGDFDERFFAYFEDVDWSLRARLRGHRCVYVPSAVVRHAVGATSARMSVWAARLRARNAVYVIVRVLPAPLLVAALPGFLVTRLGGLVARALQGQLRATLAGYADALRDLPWALRSRHRIQSERRVGMMDFARALDPSPLRREQVRRLRALVEVRRTVS
jgi:GT2 family glycosyltransferase